jgi:hypothetical protein
LHVSFYFIIIIGSFVVLKCPKENKISKKLCNFVVDKLACKFFFLGVLGFLFVL